LTLSLSGGETINNTYTISKKIGAGAFADVYLVKHRFLGLQAMKVFRQVEASDNPKGTTGRHQLEILPNENLKEARTLVDLSHSHIVRVYDADVFTKNNQEVSFMTMEYAEQGTLDSWISDQIRLTATDALGIGIQIAGALAHTHLSAPPLIHRDIKPSNILITARFPGIQVKVSDFGLASTLDPETRLCQSAGTLAFAPPETAWGIADERTDVYAIGVTLYRLLTGIHPYPITQLEEARASRKFTLILGKGRRSISPPSRLLMRKMPEVDALLMKALSYDMFSRQRNAQELVDEMSHVMSIIQD